MRKETSTNAPAAPEPSSSRSVSRRSFLTTTATATGAVLAMKSPLRAAGPNDSVVIGVMGTGGRGTTVAEGFEGLDGVTVKTVCDVDRTRAEYAAYNVGLVNGRRVDFTQDFHTLLDDADVDAMVIATCNHWHAPGAILACAAGKHAYVEKPCSHNPHEGELMVAAAKKHNRQVQHGTQRRSGPAILAGLAKLREGAIGRVYYAHTYYRNVRPSLGVGREVAVPEYLDFDLWQGPAPRRPYKDNLLHYNWHWRWHWGNGELGNNGVHRVDIARAGLGVKYPVHVVSSGGRFHWPGDDQETPDTQIATFRFEGDKALTWEALSCTRKHPGERENELFFYGDDGTAVFTKTTATIYDKADHVVEEFRGGGNSDIYHFQNFVDAIRGEKPLNAPITEAHPSALLCHLGNIAYRTGRALRCDPTDGRILNDAEAMRYWKREYESGWEPVV